MFEFLSLCACRRNQILVKGSVSALRWSGNQCLLQWNTVHSGNDGEHSVNVHPLEGDQGPYRDCSRCVCCIRAGLGVEVYCQILGSQPVKSTSAIKMLLEYVVFCCWHACLLFTNCSRPVGFLFKEQWGVCDLTIDIFILSLGTNAR